MMIRGKRLPAVLAICLCFIAVLVLTRGKAPGDDLVSSYIAGSIIGTDDETHLYSHDTEFFHILDDPLLEGIARGSGFNGFPHPYVQTPLWAVILRPLCGMVRFPAFSFIFLLLNLSAVIGMVLLTAEMWAPRFRRPLWLAGCLVVFFFMEPLRYTVFLNQTHPIFLFLAMLAVYLVSKGHDIPAGLVLALAAAVKLTPALLAVYWLFTRRYKATLSFVLWSALLAGLTALAAGMETSLAYVSELKRLSSILLTAYNNQSLAAFMNDLTGRIGTDLFSWRIYTLSLHARILSAGSTLLVIALLTRARDRFRNVPVEFEGLAISAVLIAMTVFTPIAWSHYFIVLIIPLMVLADRAAETRSRLLPPMLALVVALNVYPVAMSSGFSGSNTCLLVRSQFAAGIILLAMLMKEVYSPVSTFRHLAVGGGDNDTAPPGRGRP